MRGSQLVSNHCAASEARRRQRLRGRERQQYRAIASCYYCCAAVSSACWSRLQNNRSFRRSGSISTKVGLLFVCCVSPVVRICEGQIVQQPILGKSLLLSSERAPRLRALNTRTRLQAAGRLGCRLALQYFLRRSCMRGILPHPNAQNFQLQQPAASQPQQPAATLDTTCLLYTSPSPRD